MAASRVDRRLTAVLAADVVGYSRLMERDEVETLRTLTGHRQIMDRLITEHGGRIANTAGDSVLAEFPSAVNAVECAIKVQRQIAESPSDPALQFRIAVHVGDVMVRTALFEAANVMLSRVTRFSTLKAWALRVAKLRGVKRAKVALARKLAVVLHRMWVDATDFRWRKASA